MHPQGVTDKPPCSQHLEGDGRDEDQDADGTGARQDDERHDDQDARDPRQDIQHAKNISAKTITAKDITAKDNNGKNGTKVPREGARYQGTRSREEAKEDEEAYEEAMSTLRGLLNEYAEGKNG